MIWGKFYYHISNKKSFLAQQNAKIIVILLLHHVESMNKLKVKDKGFVLKVTT